MSIEDEKERTKMISRSHSRRKTIIKQVQKLENAYNLLFGKIQEIKQELTDTYFDNYAMFEKQFVMRGL